jgi:hypothetical protein
VVAKAPVLKALQAWSPYWVAMWCAIFVILMVAAFFIPFWDWMRDMAILFGVPEAIGTIKQHDRYPPLTHVMVRYVDREISFPIMFGFAGAIGAHWFGLPNARALGLFAALLGWLNAHFDRRYEVLRRD